MTHTLYIGGLTAANHSARRRRRCASRVAAAAARAPVSVGTCGKLPLALLYPRKGRLLLRCRLFAVGVTHL